MNTLKHTGDLLKMDLRRTFRTQPFYWLLLGVATMVMVVFMVGGKENGTTLTGLLGSYTAEEYDPISTMMGVSMAPLFAMIAFVLNIGGDFSTGFAKNIFAFHANKWEYVISKTALGTIISSLYILAYMAGFFCVGMIMGLPWGAVGIGEVALFIVSKMILTVPLSAIVLLVMALLRNRGWGIVAGIVVSMGAITMCMTMIAEAVGLGWLATLATWFVSGCAGSMVVMASAGQFAHVIAVAALWTILCSILSWRWLKTKDIV